MKNRTAIAAAILGTAASLAVPAPSHAADQRHCVSTDEAYSLPGYVSRYGYPDRATLERRWEVVGLGRPTDIEVFGNIIAYPRCGYGFDPVEPQDGESFFGIWYDSRNRARALVWAPRESHS
jgi:hypothetical protein